MKNKNAVLADVEKLVNAYRQGNIPVLEQHELHPNLERGSRENYLYFTLVPSLNFQRSSPALWKSALETYEDESTRFVFSPELVVATSEEQLRSALTKHKLALQHNKHTAIWQTICHTLHGQFFDDPRKVLKEGRYDILQIINLLQTTYKKGFPYLSGPKLSNYWLFILQDFTDAQFANPHEISIIPDTHITQSSIRLGLVDEKASPQEVDQVWRTLLEGTGLSPTEMHCVLWNWSRNNFQINIPG